MTMKKISILAFNVLIITLVYVGVMKIIDARYKEPITMSCYLDYIRDDVVMGKKGRKTIIIDFEENLYIEVIPCGRKPGGGWDCKISEHIPTGYGEYITASELHETDNWYGYNERYLGNGIYRDYIASTHTTINRKTLRYRQSNVLYGLEEGKCSILDMPPERDSIIQKARKDWNSKQPPKNNQI